MEALKPFLMKCELTEIYTQTDKHTHTQKLHISNDGTFGSIASAELYIKPFLKGGRGGGGGGEVERKKMRFH